MEEKDKRLAIIQTYINKMPSLPITVSKILEVCNNPKTSPADLNQVIALDPVLMGRVMKLDQLRLLLAEQPDHQPRARPSSCWASTR